MRLTYTIAARTPYPPFSAAERICNVRLFSRQLIVSELMTFVKARDSLYRLAAHLYTRAEFERTAPTWSEQVGR
jgi:hypothetical protein